MGANYTPNLGEYTELKPFRYWCQKVMPLVYDDSLSYYELLCKVVDYLNKTMHDVDTLHTDVVQLHAAYIQLQQYVNTYFENLDLQSEIDRKLDEMAESGALLNIIKPSVIEEVNRWLTAHITNPSNPPIDKSLTIENAAADAKETGNKINSLNEDIVNTNQILNVLDVKNANVTPINATYDNLLFTQTGLFPRFSGLNKNKKYRVVIKTTKTNNISLKAFKAGEFLKTYVQNQNIDNNSKFITDIFWEYDDSEVSLCIVNETIFDLSPMYIGIYDITDLNNVQISMINEPVTLLQKYNLFTWYQNKKLTALGDSVTEQARYLNFLKDILYFNTIQNCGEGGTTVAGTSPHAMNNDARINKMNNDSDVVLFMGGINDWIQNIQLGAIDDTDVSTFYGALNSIAEKLTTKYPTKIIVFMGTTYAIYHGNQFSEDGLKNANGLTTKDYSDCIMNVAKKYGIPFVDLYANCGWNKFNISSFVTNDGAYLHPNENGSKRMGKIIYSKLVEVMPTDYIS